MNAPHEKRVSFDDEPLIVVDEDDNVLDYRPKAELHEGDGILHRAFSVFLFNGKGEVLLQQRHADKMLWGGYWSNSCCSHPRRGESVPEAAGRRIEEELGVATALEYVYTFTYHARFGDAGSEREGCSVFLGSSDAPIQVNETEIADWRWIAIEDLTAELTNEGERYTPWLKMEWARLRGEFDTILSRYADRV